MIIITLIDIATENQDEISIKYNFMRRYCSNCPKLMRRRRAKLIVWTFLSMLHFRVIPRVRLQSIFIKRISNFQEACQLITIVIQF